MQATMAGRFAKVRIARVVLTASALLAACTDATGEVHGGEARFDAAEPAGIIDAGADAEADADARSDADARDADATSDVDAAADR